MKNRVDLVCPRLRIPEKVWKKLRAYVEACPMEVGGLGTVEMIDGQLCVTEIFLLEQEVSSATTVLDPAGVAKFFSDWIKDGKDTALLRFWWHSHATMAVGWSSLDLATINLLSTENFLVSYVGNHKGDQLARLTFQKPVRIAVNDLPIDIVPEVDDKLREEVAAEVKLKVRKCGWWKFGSDKAPPPVVEEKIEADINSVDPFDSFSFKGGSES